MDARRLAYLDALGVTTYVRREPADRPVTGPGEEPSGEPVGVLGWRQLEAAVLACERCGLSRTRTQAVFGTGNWQARVMVVGEAPGAEEDRQGEPFVGRAGQLLNSMLRAMGLARGEVFIANVLKCRPPGNRDPRPEEAAQCLPYLHRQIALIGPRVILCVGRVAAHNLLDTDLPVGRLRGEAHRLPSGVPVIVTYHPAYLLRSPEHKARAWDDLRSAIQILRDGDSH